MPGGLLQLKSCGSQDIFLTSNPTITFFKIVYRRHTNFATIIRTVDIPDIKLDDSADVVIPKYGDLVSRIFLSTTLPSVDINSETSKPPFSVKAAKLKFKKINEFYDLVSEYLDRVRKIAASAVKMAGSINASISDISAFFSDNKIVDAGADKLRTFIENTLSTDIGFSLGDMNRIKSAISYVDISSILSGIVNTVSQDKIASSIQTFITVDLYPRMKNFYYQIYPTILEQKKLLESIINGKFVDSKLFSWSNYVGNKMIDTVSVNIGPNKIDQHTGDWLTIHHKLYDSSGKTESYDRLVGNIAQLTTPTGEKISSYQLLTPLQFWFCKYPGLALPISSLTNSDVTISLSLKKLRDISIFPESVKKLDVLDISDTKFYIEYILLDLMEKQRFAESSHEYLIETTHQNVINNILGRNPDIKFDYHQPTKFIAWYIRGNNSYNKEDFTTRYIESENIRTNLISRTNSSIGVELFNLIHPWKYFNGYIPPGLNVYSFGIFPTLHQPSGSINLSRLNDFGINIKLNNLNDFTKGAKSLVSYAVSYNVLRIISGMAGLAFQ